MKELLKMLCVFIIVFFASCSDKEDDIESGGSSKEIEYAEKPKKLFYFAGHNRVQVGFILGAETEVSKSVMYWNQKKDSVVIEIDRSKMTSDTVSHIFSNMPEDIYNFEIYNYDASGNRSDAASLIAKTYGTYYLAELKNRAIELTENVDKDRGDVLINWEDSLMRTVGVKLEYTDKDGQVKTIFVNNKESVTSLSNCDVTIPLSYQTLHIPEPNAIDIFQADVVTEKIGNPLVSKELPKPYKGYFIDGFDPTANGGKGNFDVLWNGVMCQEYNYDNPWDYEWAYASGGDFHINGGDTWIEWADDDKPNDYPSWMTIDLGRRVKLAKWRSSFYWPFMQSMPKVSEVLAYVGKGAPTKETGWDDWVVIGSMDNSGMLTREQQTKHYRDGDVVEFPPTVPRAQYYRFRSLKNWKYEEDKPGHEQRRGEVTDFSLTEISVWTYEKE
ncbi:MAG: DUF4998 domain-containing protein [Dysgonomonas sp.]|nr:DUF4998 domain-containing protein [Dysgonomonas sp.]